MVKLLAFQPLLSLSSWEDAIAVWPWNKPVRTAHLASIEKTGLDWDGAGGYSDLLGYRIPAHWIDGDWCCFFVGPRFSEKPAFPSKFTEVTWSMRELNKIKNRKFRHLKQVVGGESDFGILSPFLNKSGFLVEVLLWASWPFFLCDWSY